MTARLLARMVLKVFGIYFVYSALSGVFQLATAVGLPSSGEWADAAMQRQVALSLVLQILLAGSFGVACFANTGWLVRKLFPECGDEPLGAGTAELGALAFRVLGVAFLVHALPVLVGGVLEVLWYLGAERRHLLESVLVAKGADHLYWLVTSVLAVLVFRHAGRLARGGS